MLTLRFMVDLDVENSKMGENCHHQGGSNMEYELNSEIKPTLKLKRNAFISISNNLE